MRSFLLAVGVTGGIALGSTAPAIATPNLSIYPLGWNVMGLDSNNPSVGPNRFPVGARVCNTGTSAAKNVTATFLDEGGGNDIIVTGPGLLNPNVIEMGADLPSGTANPDPRVNSPSFPTLPENCFDFYFNFQVNRSSAAYSDLSNAFSRKKFRIQVTATNSAGTPITTLFTPSNRELFVEKLISQSRNAVLSLTGPATVVQGQIVEYTVTGKTAPGGYEQLAFSPVLPTFFQLLSASINYTSPSGAIGNSVYADACGWENDPTSSFYHNNDACKNPSITAGYPGEKVGNTFTATYKIKVIGTGSGSLSNLIYDFSGSSYHYNQDLGTGVNSLSIISVPPAVTYDLAINKTPVGAFNRGAASTYNLVVTNVGATTTSGTLTVKDTLPNTLTYVSSLPSNDPNWSCGTANAAGSTVLTCTSKSGVALAPNASLTIPLVVTPTQTGTVLNTATVAIPNDGISENNTSTAAVVVNSPDPIDVSIQKDVALRSGSTLSAFQPTAITAAPGAGVVYKLTITGDGSKAVANIPIDDIFDSQLTTTNGSLNTSNTVPTTGLATCRIVAAGSGNGDTTCTLTMTNNVLSGTVTLKKGSQIEVYIPATVKTTAFGAISNIAYLSPSPTDYTDTNSANNSDAATVNVDVPDLKITKTHTGNFARRQTGSYTLTVQNIGIKATSGPVTVTDTVPMGLVPQTATGTGWNCSISGQTVTCTRSDSLAPNASYPPITLTVAIANSAPASLTNTVTVGGGGENNTGNNTAQDPTNITDPAPLPSRSCAIGTATFDWSALSWTPNGSLGPYQFTVGNVQYTVEVKNPNNYPFTDNSPKLGNNNFNQPALYFRPDMRSANPGQFVEVHITMRNPATGNLLPITGLQGIVDDIDRQTTGSGQWQDEVVLTGYVGGTSGTAVLPTLLPFNATNVSVNGNVATGITINNFPTGGGQGADVEYGFGNQAIDTLVVRHQPGPSLTPTSGQHVTLNNWTFCIPQASSPNLLLVKRISSILQGTPAVEQVPSSTYVDLTADPNDNAAGWPNLTATAKKEPTAVPDTTNFSALLQGIVTSNTVQPNDTVEYRIYFLSNGTANAQNVALCDFIPANSAYVPGSTTLVLGATSTPISDAIGGTDTDGGFYSAGTPTFPGACNNGTHNGKGAVLVNLGTVLRSTGVGTPANSYGYIRFRTKID